MGGDLKSELTLLRRDLLAMSAASELRVSQAFEALLERDLGIAQAVRENDDEIDRAELDLEEECLRILALHHPVATDLRHVLMTLRVNIDLERIADLAKGVCKRVLDMGNCEPVPLPDDLRRITEACSGLLSKTLRALANEDVELAREVCQEDKPIDELHNKLIDWVVHELPEHVEDTQPLVDVLFIVRAIERIGDLCTNIAEDIVFASRGDVIRHKDITSA